MDYTDLYNFQTSAGIIVPNDATVLANIQTKFQQIFGTDIDLSAETPVGRLIEAFAVMVKSTLGVTAQSANQFNVNEATGIYLDSIAQIYDLTRISATKTRINIKCYFSETQSGTIAIPAGSLIMCSSNGAMFSIDSIVRNDETDEDGRKVGYGTATAVEPGPISAPSGTVNSIQSSVLGWVGVTNIAPTYTGTNVETDEAFRRRILESRPIGIGFTTHLVSALNRLDGVYSNCVLENSTGMDMVQKDIIIPPHSIYVGIDCISTDELYQAIGQEIARVKPVGTGMVNSGIPQAELVFVPMSYGYGGNYKQDIYFYKAKRTAIYVDITYNAGNYTGSDLEGDIATVTANYIEAIGVGGTIYSAMLANTLISQLDIGVSSLLLQKDGSDLAADTFVEMMGYEAPYTSSMYVNAHE